MRPKTLPHILERNITRTSNVLRRGNWVHHEYRAFARFPGWEEVLSHTQATLQDVELGRRVSDGLLTEAINKRVNNSPFGTHKVAR